MPFLFYLITGAFTAAHILYLMLWSVWGAPIHPLEYVSLCGSLIVLASAFISLFRPRDGSRIALVGLLGNWSFYLPAIRKVMASRVPIAWHGPSAGWGLGAITMLVICTIYAVLTIAGVGRPAWLFPTKVDWRSRRAALVPIAILLLLCGAFLFAIVRRSEPQTFVYLFPKGYIGWVRIEFGVRGAPQLPLEHGKFVAKVTTAGTLRTSSVLSRIVKNEFVYYDGDQRISAAPVARGFVVQRQSDNQTPAQEFLFVGTSGELHEHENDPVGADGMPKPGAVGRTPSG